MDFASEQSGSKFNWKFTKEFFFDMASEKVPSTKDLTTAIQEISNHLIMNIALN